MKCQKCGAELESGVLFCRECGNKAEKQGCFCRECGFKVEVGSKFCSNCGTKVTPQTAPVEPVQTYSGVEKASSFESVVEKNRTPSTKTTTKRNETLGEKLKEKISVLWGKLSLYGKITTIAIGIFSPMCMVAILSGKIVAVVISIFQIAMTVVSLLMHRGIIKLEQTKLWLKWLILAVAILFTVLNIISYSWGAKTPATGLNPSSANPNSDTPPERIEWKNITLSTVLPEPQSNMMYLLYNGDDWLYVTICGISENDYLEYVRWCREDYGFTVDSDAFDDYFYAYNQDGYYITLFYTETAKELSIDLSAPAGDATDNPDDATEKQQLEQTEQPKQTEPSMNDTTVRLPFGNSECTGRKQEEIVDALELAGFTNISSMPIPELEASEIERKGEICNITLDSQEIFYKGDEVDKTAVIEITYYETKEITAPITSEEAETVEAEMLANLFKDAGFLDVTVEIKEDIDPGYSQEAFQNEVSINSDSTFSSSDKFAIDSQVTITSHRPMEKYKIKINIDFIPNFFFDKYSVDVEISYKDLGTLSHGEDNTYEIWLKPGQHTITFTKHSYKKPESKASFTIRGETEITYQISCYEDSIHVEQTEFIYKGAVGEKEAMVPASAQDFKYDNYKDVQTSLKNAGFTNIKTTILYDIVWGWTSEGEVDSVSIDGNDEFLKGAIFNKAAEVIITYHMMAEDDPSRIKVTRNASEYEGLNCTYVEQELKELGFTNIVFDDEITTNTCYHTGEVLEVRINYSEFEAGDSFPADAELKITRYKVDSAEAKPSITVTMNGDNFTGMHYTEAEVKVREMGFTNIVYRERITHDLDVAPETIDFVAIDSIYSFKAGEMFDNDAEVIIAYWKYEEFQSEYEKAYVRRMQNYSIYYMFDTDAKKVAYFYTDDSGISYASYQGDFDGGITIHWTNGQGIEKFIFDENGSSVILVDGNGDEWKFVETDLINAQKQMDDLN